MKKRPLCTICILFLIVQWIRALYFGTEVSVLERAVREEPQVELAGTVYKIEKKDKVTALFLKENVVSVNGRTVEESGILVYVSNDNSDKNEEERASEDKRAGDGIRLGNRLHVLGEAQIFEEARNPGSFDQRVYYERQGIHVLVWADEAVCISSKTDRVKQFLFELRTQWEELFRRHLGEYYGGTMSAVLLGEKSGLDDEMKKTYQKNGISHLLAISGLHMSFIGMGIYGLMRRAGCGFFCSGTAGGVLLLFYSLMIGAGVSSLRALIMFLVKIGAEITGRDYDLLTSLTLSAAVLCAWQPLWLTDAGFLLSYGAILGLFLLTPVFEEMFGCTGDKRRLKRIFGGLCSSLAVNVLLMGPLLYFYYEVPPYSVFLNLIVIPVMPAVMSAGVAGSLLCLFSDTLGGCVLQICRAVLWGYDLVCAAGSALPCSRYVTGKPGVGWLILYYTGIAAVCLLFRYLLDRREQAEEFRKTGSVNTGRGLPGREDLTVRIPGALLLLFAAGMTVACRQQYRVRDEMQVTVLDVGQGDCIYVSTPSLDCLIDGGSSTVSSVGVYRIEPFLLSRAVDRLDHVFVTHGDEDHTNGILELLESQELGVGIDDLVLPPVQYHDEKITEMARTAAENETEVLIMGPGDRITDSGAGACEASLTCLAPGENESIEPGNAASLVLEVSFGGHAMLFAGDIEGEGEQSLIQSGRLRDYDVLKAAHHGSKNSGPEEFLELTSPDYALISAGVDNRYGHPHDETIKRLKDAGCTVYSTQDNGAVTLRTDGECLEMTGFVQK